MSIERHAKSIKKSFLGVASALILTAPVGCSPPDVKTPKVPVSRSAPTQAPTPCMLYELSSEELNQKAIFDFDKSQHSGDGRFTINFEQRFISEHPCFILSKILWEKQIQFGLVLNTSDINLWSVSALLSRTDETVVRSRLTRNFPSPRIEGNNQLSLVWERWQFIEYRLNDLVFRLEPSPLPPIRDLVASI